jgi:hypothetical protein
MGFPLDSLLRGLASRWIVSDSLDQADAIVVLGGGLDIRPSAAAELYKRGTCVYRKSKSERIDDEVRPVSRANL